MSVKLIKPAASKNASKNVGDAISITASNTSCFH
jgi:hypothetical protein